MCQPLTLTPSACAVLLYNPNLVPIGNIGRSERALWKQACGTAEDSVAAYYPDRLQWIATKFREFGVVTVRATITLQQLARAVPVAAHRSAKCSNVVLFSRLPYQAEDLHQCFDPQAEVSELETAVKIKQLWYNVGVFLSC